MERFGVSSFRMTIAPGAAYSDAQLDDHRRLARSRFPWREGFSVSLRAEASHRRPLGTLGFGLWNDPFAVSLGQGGAARRLPAPPKAIWFFYCSEPSQLALAPAATPHGWKASTLDSPPLPSLVLGPMAAAAVGLAQIPLLRGPILRGALRAARAAEASIPMALDEEHEYTLSWSEGRASFRVDNTLVLESLYPSRGPLGFVTWIDNQYAVVSPQAGFGFGVIPTEEEQWLEVRELRLEGGS